MDSPSAEAAERGLTTRCVELVVALGIIAGGAVVIYDSIRIGAEWASDGPQAGYFPYLTGWALALAGIWIATSTLWRWRKLEGQVFVSWANLKPVLSMLLPTIAFVVLLRWIGIYAAAAIYIAAFMLWQGKYRLLPALAVSLGMPIAVFMLFELWFLVPLPKGPIERMLGY
jgi:hypothetical protein